MSQLLSKPYRGSRCGRGAPARVAWVSTRGATASPGKSNSPRNFLQLPAVARAWSPRASGIPLGRWRSPFWTRIAKKKRSSLVSRTTAIFLILYYIFFSELIFTSMVLQILFIDNFTHRLLRTTSLSLAIILLKKRN